MICTEFVQKSCQIKGLSDLKLLLGVDKCEMDTTERSLSSTSRKRESERGGVGFCQHLIRNMI